MKRQGNLEKNQNNRNVEVKDLKYRPNRLSEDELKNVFGGAGRGGSSWRKLIR